jgi:hypothetical protein
MKLPTPANIKIQYVLLLLYLDATVVSLFVSVAVSTQLCLVTLLTVKYHVACDLR